MYHQRQFIVTSNSELGLEGQIKVWVLENLKTRRVLEVIFEAMWQVSGLRHAFPNIAHTSALCALQGAQVPSQDAPEY